MTLDQLSSASQIIAAIAVVASLIYLGVQVRQTEINQRASMLQARTDRGIALSKCFTEPFLADTLAKVMRADDDLDASQRAALLGYLRSLAMNLLDAEAQHRAGLLSDAGFERAKKGAGWFFSMPQSRVTWRLRHSQFTVDDIATIERLIIAPIPLAVPVDLVSEGRVIRADLLRSDVRS